MFAEIVPWRALACPEKIRGGVGAGVQKKEKGLDGLNCFLGSTRQDPNVLSQDQWDFGEAGYGWRFHPLSSPVPRGHWGRPPTIEVKILPMVFVGFVRYPLEHFNKRVIDSILNTV